MFRKIIGAFTIAFIACFSAIYYFQIKEREEDATEYMTLIAEAQALRSKKSLKFEPATQTRIGVQKDIWTSKDRERTHFCLKSENSDLVISEKSHKLDMVEYLHNLECFSQEGIDRSQNKQEVRALRAELGIYFFPSHRFITDKVDLFFFYLLGTDLPIAMPNSIPYLRGKARDVTFTADNKSLQFTAQHLKANLDSQQVHQ